MLTEEGYIRHKVTVDKTAGKRLPLARVLHLHAREDPFIHERQDQIEFCEMLRRIGEDLSGKTVFRLLIGITDPSLDAALPFAFRFQFETSGLDLLHIP